MSRMKLFSPNLNFMQIYPLTSEKMLYGLLSNKSRGIWVHCYVKLWRWRILCKLCSYGLRLFSCKFWEWEILWKSIRRRFRLLEAEQNANCQLYCVARHSWTLCICTNLWPKHIWAFGVVPDTTQVGFYFIQNFRIK